MLRAAGTAVGTRTECKFYKDAFYFGQEYLDVSHRSMMQWLRCCWDVVQVLAMARCAACPVPA